MDGRYAQVSSHRNQAFANVWIVGAKLGFMVRTAAFVLATETQMRLQRFEGVVVVFRGLVLGVDSRRALIQVGERKVKRAPTEGERMTALNWMCPPSQWHLNVMSQPRSLAKHASLFSPPPSIFDTLLPPDCLRDNPPWPCSRLANDVYTSQTPPTSFVKHHHQASGCNATTSISCLGHLHLRTDDLTDRSLSNLVESSHVLVYRVLPSTTLLITAMFCLRRIFRRSTPFPLPPAFALSSDPYR
jgi:hypothetical protein